MEINKEQLSALLLDLQLDPSIRTALLRGFDIWQDRLVMMADQAFIGQPETLPVCRRKPFTRLLLTCCCLLPLKAHFVSRGIPRGIYLDTISDLTLRIQLYQEAVGKLGLSCRDVRWFYRLVHFSIFKLGALQFELAEMTYPEEMKNAKPCSILRPELRSSLPSGTPVLRIHIQKGASLERQSVAESLQFAQRFFIQYFPEHDFRAFVCDSWLLYPGLRSLLSENSRIAQFADRFLLAGSVQDPAESIRRIYGKRYRRRADYPSATALQAAAIGHFSQLGEGCGVILLGESSENA